MGRYIILLIIIYFARGSFAQDGIIGAAGKFSTNIGNAARLNRQVADQLMKQALQDEQRALSTFPPNVSLLAKAGQTALDGMRADDQAKHFAQASVHAIHTGKSAGQFDPQKFGGISEAELRSLATANNPLRDQVHSRMAAWGFKPEENGAAISLPLGMGKVPLTIDMSEVERGMRTAARLLGFNPDDVSSGLKQSIAARDALIASIEVPAALGETQAQTLDRHMPSAEKDISPATTLTTSLDEGVIDVNDKEMELTQFRIELQRRMGISLDEVKGRSDQDIFQMVHSRYQVLRRTDAFIESLSSVVAARTN